LAVQGPKTFFGVKTENGQAYAWPSINRQNHLISFQYFL